MNIYVVTEDRYGISCEYLGVFSSREKAEHFICERYNANKCVNYIDTWFYTMHGDRHYRYVSIREETI